MAINYASKFTNQVEERFNLSSLSGGAVNNDFDFVGVNAITTYSLPTVDMNDYNMSGLSRYGNPTELQDTTHTYIMGRDRSFTFTIDRRNYSDTMMIKEAGKALARQIDEVVTPEVDMYRFQKIASRAGLKQESMPPIDRTNAYEAFLDAQAILTENKVPKAGMFAYITPTVYKSIKLDDSFIKKGDMSQKIAINGVVGEIDGIPITVVPASYLPAGIEFMITNKIANPAPLKLSEYKIHDNPPGINGWLVEGRLYYDCFTHENKKLMTYVYSTATVTVDSSDVTLPSGNTTQGKKLTP